jgi:hypothetical protein
MKVWWVTANENRQPGWHWNSFFESDASEFQWGGPKWIRSPASKQRISEMRKGDRIVCYQAGKGVLGFAVVNRNGYAAAGDSVPDQFDLSSRGRVRLEILIPYEMIKLLPGAEQNFEFVRSPPGTVKSIEGEGYAQIAGLAIAMSPGQVQAILKCFRLT